MTDKYPLSFGAAEIVIRQAPDSACPWPLCSKAVENLTKGGGSEVQRVKEDARRKVQQVEDLLTERIHLLEEVSLEMLWSVLGRVWWPPFSMSITFLQQLLCVLWVCLM